MMANTMHLPRRWFAPREPAAPAAPFRDDMDRIFQAMFNGMAAPWDAMNDMLPFWRHQKAETALLPDMDLTSDDKAYTLRMELPGVEPENVTVEVRDNALVVSGEKKRDSEEEKKNQHVMERVYGSFQRVLALPDDADVAGIAATHKNGVLSVSIPRKAPAAAERKTIEITRA
ncbi:Hsp20/alpha crystallin family protein [Desulfovibrio legallii]|uniref:Heat shock protein Hsp20 n=1 Tax=Desulfovibrio legallii TaxID=571438 RepID=A0A1G7MKG7_9BACT|nr:Hsp20/alpha crystallin family protein [Desulfovibrio legallii]SDF62233.1 heat shock protein Hsp20 [Desulfovibrio legallii]